MKTVIIYSPSCRSKPVRVSFLCKKEDILKNAGNQAVDGPLLTNMVEPSLLPQKTAL